MVDGPPKTHMKSGTKSSKNKGGRPIKLNDAVQEEICMSIRAGNYIETSSIRAGVSKQVLHVWIKRAGKELDRLRRDPDAEPSPDEAIYVRFLDAVKKAEADAEARDVALIGEAALTQWQAAAWRLERKNYKRWGRRQQLEHTGPEGRAVEVQVINVGGKEIKF